MPALIALFVMADAGLSALNFAHGHATTGAFLAAGGVLTLLFLVIGLTQ